MSVYSELVVDGVTGDIYDKTAVHTDTFPDVFAEELESSIATTVINLFSSLGAEFDE